MSNPQFSIVIPIYNRADFLDESVGSVLKQTVSDLEVICINDGSSDNSLEKLEEIKKQDSRVVIVNQENKGRCIARNVGIENAKGEWICLLDSDDYFLENHLEVLSNLIDKKPNQLAFSTEQTFNKQPKNYPSSKFNQDLYEVKFEDFLEANPISPNQLCFKKEKIKTRFENERIPISEDWLFMRRLIQETSILKSNIVTTDVNTHDDRTVDGSNMIEIAKWNRYTGFLFAEKYAPKNLSIKIKGYTLLLCANMLLSKGLKKDAKPYFKEALKFGSNFTHPLFFKGLIKFVAK